MRKVIQISAVPNGSVYALCDDGTMWLLLDTSETWVEIPDVPQGKSA